MIEMKISCKMLSSESLKLGENGRRMAGRNVAGNDGTKKTIKLNLNNTKTKTRQ